MNTALRSTTSPVEIRTDRLVVRQAVAASEIEAALRLRFAVFNVELDEGLHSSWETGRDVDQFDPFCDHMVVMDAEENRIIGTYRLLPGARVEKSLGYYSETEFEMSSFRQLTGNKLELGRACVHPDYRGSNVLNLMWAGIAQYVIRHDIHYLFGCASIHSINPKTVGAIYGHLSRYVSAPPLRAAPLKRVPGFAIPDRVDKNEVAKLVPPLLLAYIRLGAQIAGEPALDEQFGVSDFLVFLDRSKLTQRFSKRYF